MATALTARTTAAAASRPASCRCTPSTRATKPEGHALDGHDRMTERIEAQPQDRHGADQHGAGGQR